MPSAFPQGPELKTYGSYLRDLITRLDETQNITSRNMINSKLKSKQLYDSKSRPLKAKIGDYLYVNKEVRLNKFDKRADGPYTIIAFTENNNVTLEDKSGKRVMKHKDKIIPIYC